MADYDLSNLNVLVVDDNHHMHTILRAILSAMRIKHSRFCDGPADALDVMKTWVPDILMTNWKMEPVDGLEFVKQVRRGKDSPNHYMPIIMLSGHSEAKHVLEARDAGVNEFLTKPVSIKALYSRMVRVISDPRVFIRNKTYFGPCRRRLGAKTDYNGPWRRHDDPAHLDEDSAKQAVN